MISPEHILSTLQYYIPNPDGGEPLALVTDDVDLQISLCILEELRGIRRGQAEIFNQLIDIETAIQNSSR